MQGSHGKKIQTNKGISTQSFCSMNHVYYNILAVYFNILL
jgi:hypothetical protein